jgi:3'-5' exoribonuclease
LRIAEIRAGQSVAGTFLVAAPEVRTSRSGEAYLRVTLRDEDRDSIAALYFGVAEDLAASVESGQTYTIEGRAEEFRGQLNVKLSSMEHSVTQWDATTLLPHGEQDASAMQATIAAAAESLGDAEVRAVVQTVLLQPMVAERLPTWPAAKGRHHAWIGGLAEHVVEMLQLAERVAEIFPELDRDLLVAGVILHDLGKVLELGVTAEFTYTAEGNLEGHMVHGVRLLDQAVTEVGCGAETAMLLRHLILSHQGLREYAAVVEPMTPEAVALHFIDQLSSQVRPAVEDVNAATARGVGGISFRGATSMRQLYARSSGIKTGDGPV